MGDEMDFLAAVVGGFSQVRSEFMEEEGVVTGGVIGVEGGVADDVGEGNLGLGQSGIPQHLGSGENNVCSSHSTLGTPPTTISIPKTNSLVRGVSDVSLDVSIVDVTHAKKEQLATSMSTISPTAALPAVPPPAVATGGEGSSTASTSGADGRRKFTISPSNVPTNLATQNYNSEKDINGKETGGPASASNDIGK